MAGPANKPSPSPWAYENVSDCHEKMGYGVVRDANGKLIFDSLNSDVAEIWREDDENDGIPFVTFYDLQGEADLRLASAAPDLLAACKALRATMHNPKSEESILADAAIAKATGQPTSNV